MQFIDLTEHRCPLVLVKVKMAIKQLAVGQQLQFAIYDRLSREDVPKYLQQLGHHVQIISNTIDKFEFIVTKSSK